MPKRQSTHTSGFTIVELLIVIVVIGILAAIVIVAYQGVTKRANDTTVRSDLANLAKKLEADKTMAGSDTYPVSESELTSANIKATKSAYDTTINNFVYCRSDANSTMFAIVAKSKGGAVYYVTNTSMTPKEYTNAFPSARSTICGTGSGGFGATVTTGDPGLFGLTPGTWATWVK